MARPGLACCDETYPSASCQSEKERDRRDEVGSGWWLMRRWSLSSLLASEQLISAVLVAPRPTTPFPPTLREALSGLVRGCSGVSVLMAGWARGSGRSVAPHKGSTFKAEG